MKNVSHLAEEGIALFVQVPRTMSLPRKRLPSRDLIAWVAACTSRKTTCACPLIFIVFKAMISSTVPYVEKSMYSAVFRSSFCILDEGRLVTYNLAKRCDQQKMTQLRTSKALGYVRLVWWNWRHFERGLISGSSAMSWNSCHDGTVKFLRQLELQD